MLETLINENMASTITSNTVIQIFKELYTSLNICTTEKPINDSYYLIEKTKEYISIHYKEQISLISVADYLNINSAYLSTLFAKYTNETYSKYLTRIRMEQAILILKSNPYEKIYKVAEQTGFISSKHFNNVFKKFYGITPTEWCNNNL